MQVAASDEAHPGVLETVQQAGAWFWRHADSLLFGVSRIGEEQRLVQKEADRAPAGLP